MRLTDDQRAVQEAVRAYVAQEAMTLYAEQ